MQDKRTLYRHDRFGEGWVQDWLVLGPIFYGYADFHHDRSEPAAAEIDFLAGAGGQGAVRPKQGDSVSVQGETFEWQAWRSDEFSIDLEKAFKAACDQLRKEEMVERSFLPQGTAWRVAYCCVYLDSDRDQEVRLWPAAVNYHLWVNGRAVWAPLDFLNVNRLLAPNNEQFAVPLSKGVNIVLLKTAGGSAYDIPAPLGLRITGSSGGAVEGVRVLTDLPEERQPLHGEPLWPFPQPEPPAAGQSPRVEQRGRFTVLRIDAGQFSGQSQTRMLFEDSTPAYRYERPGTIVFAPATARFTLDQLPGSPTGSADQDEKVKTRCLFHLHGARYGWPWTPEVPTEPGVEKQPALEIKVNGQMINNVRQPGSVNHHQGALPFYQMELIIDMPPELLRIGENTVSVDLVEGVDFDPRREPIFALELCLFTETDGEFTRVPRVCHAGRPFYIKLLFLQPQTIESIEGGDAIRSAVQLPQQLEAGEHSLAFEAVHPASDVDLCINTNRGSYRTRIPFICSVADPDAIKFSVLITHSSYTGSPDALRQETDIVNDLELGNAITPRSLLANGTSAETGRQLGAVIKDSGLFFNTHWHIYHGYTRLDPAKTQFDQKDLDEWTGGLLLRDGTRRPDPDAFMADSPGEFVDRFMEKLKETYGGKYRLAFHTNQMWYRYGAAAGACEVWIQIGYVSTEMALSAKRGTARAYDIVLGCSNCEDNAFVHNGSVQEQRIITLHDRLCYMGGCTDFLTEGMTYPSRSGTFLPHCRGYDSFRYSRKILAIHQSFWDFLRSRDYWDGPQPTLGFVMGRYDLWDGSHQTMRGWDEGCYEPGAALGFLQHDVNDGLATHWAPDAPEAGYELLEVIYPGIRFGLDYPKGPPVRRQHWFQPSPHGKADLVPEEATVAKLCRYPALIFPGWNSATETQVSKLAAYVEAGGTLLMAVPQLSTGIERDSEINLVNQGDLAELFGVCIKGRGAEISAIRQGDKLVELAGHPSRKIHLADAEMKGATPVWFASDTDTPVLVENRIGKGRALLLTLWNYPGEEKLLPLMRGLVGDLAREHQGPVRFSGSEWVNYSVFTRNGEPGKVPTVIYFVGIDWWEMDAPEEQALLHLGELSMPVAMPRDDMASVTWCGDLALGAMDKMVFVERIESTGENIEAIVQGAGLQSFRFVLARCKEPRVTLDGRGLSVEVANGVSTFECRLAGRHLLSFETGAI